MASRSHKARQFIISAVLWAMSCYRCLLSASFLTAAMALPTAAMPSSTHLQTAIELINQGDLVGAEKEARLALNSPEERAPAWGVLGTIRVQQKKYDAGAEFLLKAIALNPRLVGARVTLGGVYILQGKKDSARQMFAEALRLDPGNFNARFNLAQMESDAGEFQASLEATQPIGPALHHAPEGLVLLAADYSGLQQTDALAGLVPDWKALEETPPELTVAFTTLLINSGLGTQAIEILEAARLANLKSPDLAFALGRGYFLTKDVAKAEQNFRVALLLNPACAACDMEIARIAGQQGDSEKSLAYLIKARKLAPEDPEILFEFGKACLDRTLLDDALPALQKAVSLRPERDDYVYYLGSAYVSVHKLPEAASLWGQLLKKRPDDGGLNYAMGIVYYLQQKYAEAQASFTRSIQAQPGQMIAYYYMAKIYDTQGRDDQAVPILQNLVQRHSEHAPTHTLLGTIYLREHKYEEARSELERAAVLDPDSVQPHQQLGLLLRRIGDPAGADQQSALAETLESNRRAKSKLHLHILEPE